MFDCSADFLLLGSCLQLPRADQGQAARDTAHDSVYRPASASPTLCRTVPPLAPGPEPTEVMFYLLNDPHKLNSMWYIIQNGVSRDSELSTSYSKAMFRDEVQLVEEHWYWWLMSCSPAQCDDCWEAATCFMTNVTCEDGLRVRDRNVRTYYIY